MEELKQYVLETANATINISVNKKGEWQSTLGNTKETFTSVTLPDLCHSLSNYIKSKRVVKTPTPVSPKGFTL